MQTCPKCILQLPHTVYGVAVLRHCGCAEVLGMSVCWRMLCGGALCLLGRQADLSALCSWRESCVQVLCCGLVLCRPVSATCSWRVLLGGGLP